MLKEVMYVVQPHFIKHSNLMEHGLQYIREATEARKIHDSNVVHDINNVRNGVFLTATLHVLMDHLKFAFLKVSCTTILGVDVYLMPMADTKLFTSHHRGSNCEPGWVDI